MNALLVGKISFVIPCYRSEKTLPSVIGEIKATMAKRPQLDYEIICVSDASPDGVYGVINKMSEADTHIVGAELIRNFGQHAALMAGYRMATGDIIVSLDDDGQTPVDETFKLLNKMQEGYDVVYGAYVHKKHSSFRNFGSFINKFMAEKMIGQPQNVPITSFFAMTKQVSKAICAYTGPYVYLAGLLLRVTHKLASVSVRHRARLAGSSGYTIHKLLSLWLNGFTAFSIKPLRVATILGICSSVVSLLYMAYVVVQRFFVAATPLGWSSLMAAIFFCGGMILMVLGMIGEYVGRIYICINAAPQYVIRRQTKGDTVHK